MVPRFPGSGSGVVTMVQVQFRLHQPQALLGSQHMTPATSHWQAVKLLQSRKHARVGVGDHVIGDSYDIRVP